MILPTGSGATCVFSAWVVPDSSGVHHDTVWVYGEDDDGFLVEDNDDQDRVPEQRVEGLLRPLGLGLCRGVERILGGHEPFAEIHPLLVSDFLGIVLETLSHCPRIEMSAHPADVQMRAALGALVPP